MRWKDFKDILKRGAGRGTCPHQLAFLLEFGLRRFILSPETLAERLELEEAARVLELGPGPGYFSGAVARRVPKGFLLLVDLQREMLQKVRGKLAESGLGNLGFVQADAAALPVAGGAWDCVFLVAVLGEVSDARSCVREIYRALRPGGLLSVTEQPGDPDFVALPEARRLIEGVGFRFEKVFGGGKNYTASFRKSVYTSSQQTTAYGESLLSVESVLASGGHKSIRRDDDARSGFGTNRGRGKEGSSGSFGSGASVPLREQR